MRLKYLPSGLALISRGKLTQSLVKEFKSLYDLRSHIAHGRESKYANAVLVQKLESTTAAVYRCAVHWYW